MIKIEKTITNVLFLEKYEEGRIIDFYSNAECFSFVLRDTFYIEHNKNLTSEILEIQEVLLENQYIYFYLKNNIKCIKMNLTRYKHFHKVCLVFNKLRDLNLELYEDYPIRQNNFQRKKKSSEEIEQLFLKHTYLFLEIMFQSVNNENYYGLNYFLNDYIPFNFEDSNTIETIWNLLIEDGYIPYSYLDYINGGSVSEKENSTIKLNLYESNIFSFFKEYKNEFFYHLLKDQDSISTHEYVSLSIKQNEYFLFKLIEKYFISKNEIFLNKSIFNDFKDMLEEAKIYSPHDSDIPVYLSIQINKEMAYYLKIPFYITYRSTVKIFLKKLKEVEEAFNDNNEKEPIENKYIESISIEYIKDSIIVNPLTIIGECKNCKTSKVLQQKDLCIKCSNDKSNQIKLVKSDIESLSSHKRELLKQLLKYHKENINTVSLSDLNKSYLKENLNHLLLLNLITSYTLEKTELIFEINNLIKEEFFILDRYSYLSFKENLTVPFSLGHLKPLFASKLELHAYNQIVQSFSYYHISVKTRLIDVVSEKNPKITKIEKDYMFKAHLDFVLYSKETLKPLLVIECDGDSHSDITNKNDSKKDSILNKSGLKIIRITPSIIERNEVSMVVTPYLNSL